jgi:hypothetical protein
MGLERRKTSGNLIGGSNLIVPGQNIYNVKRFPTTFNFKKGSGVDNQRLYNTTPPKPSPLPPTPVPQVLINPIITENQEYLAVGQYFYLMYVD